MPKVGYWAHGLVLWALLLALACPTKAAAESASQTTLQDLTVTATKTEVDPSTVPFTTHSVDRDDIDRQPNPYYSNIGELIRDLPGVSVGQVYPLGPPWIHLRGTGYFIGRTIYVADGLPLLEPIMSTTINPGDVERMDVLLGPSSALYGPNASGGVVNVITRSGHEGMGANFSAGYGGFNTFRTNFHAGDRKDGLAWYLSYSGEFSDGYQYRPVDKAVQLWKLGKKQYLPTATKENARYEKNNLAGKFDWQNNKGILLSLGFNYLKAYQYDGQENLIADDDGDQLILNGRLEVPVQDWAKVKFLAGYQYFKRPSQSIVGLSMDSNGNLLQNTTPTTVGDWGPRKFIPLELQSDFYLGKDNILTAGVFYSHFRDERTTRSASTGSMLSESKWTIGQTAFYLQDQQFFMDKRLSLLAGIRHDSWKYYDIYDSGSSPTEPGDVDKSHTTYRGGAKFRINENFALRASGGTAFWPGAAVWFFRNTKAGSAWREANPNLEPEKTWMVDMGLDMDFPEWGTQGSVTVYYGEIEDMVSYRYDENPYVPGGSIVRTQNMGGAELKGIEFSLRQRLTDNLSLLGALTLSNSRVKDDKQNDGNHLRNAPDYVGSLGLQYLNPSLANLDVRLRFSGERYYDDENTDLPYFKMRAYETLDAKLWREWKLSEDWMLTTTVSAINILDKEYEIELVYMAPGFYMEGMVGLKYLF